MTRPPLVIGTAAALALLLTASAGAARSQGMPQAPPVGPEQKKYLEDMAKYLKELEQGEIQRQKAGALPGHQYAYWVKDKNDLPPTFLEGVIFHPVTWAILAGSLLLGIIGQFYLRLKPTTDPAKLAQSDPWCRAQLRGNTAPPPGAPADPKGPRD